MTSPVRCLLIALGLLAASLVQAQAYPSKPVHIVVGFPPGGAADLMGRLAAEKLTAALGKTFLVENRPGAGGTVAADAVAKAPADGYTLLLAPAVTQSIAPAIYKSLPYVPQRDFRPISLVAVIPIVLVVNPSVKASNARELVAVAKAAREPLLFSSAGSGTIPHLAGEMFKLATGVDMTHVPYKGAAIALGDLLAGRVQLMFENLPTVLGHIHTGRLRALGIAGTQRARALPDLPTLAEQGIKGVEVTSWFGIVAPAGTPDAVAALLEKELNFVLGTSEAKARMYAMGAEARPSSSAQMAELIKADTEKWAKLVRETGARAD